MIRTWMLTAAVVGLVACAGDDTKDDTDAPDTADTDDTDTTDDTDDTDTTPTGGFTIQASAIDIETGGPSAEALCADLVDPSPALTGGAPEVLLSTTVGTGGVIVFDDVVTDSVLGLLVSVKDCATSNTTVFTSATGIPPESIEGLGEGDILAQPVFVISMTLLAGMQASAEPLGFAGDLETDGLIFGFAFDTAGVPITGVAVTCDACGPSYYLDADPLDGLFSTGVQPNLATDAAAGAGWMIPAGPIAGYTAEDGGMHTFAEQLNGSTPGSATITVFFGL